VSREQGSARAPGFARAAWAIALREAASFFRLPSGWITLALWQAVSAAGFLLLALRPGEPATMRGFFALAGWLALPVAPAVSMRLLSEEYRSGTIEPLWGAPISEWAIVWGKFTGALLFLGALMLSTAPYPIALALASDPAPDLGPILAGYLSLALLGTLALSIGLVASACTSGQSLAFLASAFAMLLILLVPVVPPAMVPEALRPALGALLIGVRLDDLAKGVIDLSHVVYFVSISAWLVLVAGLVLRLRRLA
jgi:ABC-2 type transport system permease protein